MPGGSVRRARAFAPAHVTGLVVPRLDTRDPRGRGSLGAGVVLDIGVTATAQWSPGREPQLRLFAPGHRRLEISEEVARRLLASSGGRLTVRLDHAVPVRQGFGSSAAGALSTALAVAAVLDVPRRRAVEVAHLADLFGRGGLGGVAAILGGGLEVRVRAGIPPLGRVVRRPLDGPLLVGTVDRPIRSAGPLTDERHLSRFAMAQPLFDRLVADPTVDRFWEAAEQFTDLAGLTGRPLRRVLDGLRRRGARAAQAMFGGSFFAHAPEAQVATEVRRWLQRHRVQAVEVGVAREGARLLEVGRAGAPTGVGVRARGG